ncbi:BspA family leucine-rich repeat surface protein [Williamsoniiplasma lucivorax]|uniref:Lipoprotein n=1 Tax=Williamsoniiplasma lucivorax TaxID=209274 RepID=A0A2S5RFQ0_9MOLU|nr:BspA family leucine-rich repeat surface protein [Williamsoniiplasma lucivorax]PPE06154.1 hypothetical protein ELUCI_v1c04450 [Williamsoniiplasma lucivorax]
MKRLLSFLGSLTIGSGIIASSLMVVSCDKSGDHPNPGDKHQITEIEKKLQKIIDDNSKLWTAKALQEKIEQIIPEAMGIEVKQDQIDDQIGVEIFNLDATKTKKLKGQLELRQVLNEENQNKTIYIDPMTKKIAISNAGAPPNTLEVLNIGWDSDGVAYVMPPTIQKVPNYISPHITKIDHLFDSAMNFNSNEVSFWDTSKITSMKSTFVSNNMFNQDLSQWDVSQVKDMTQMFCLTRNFNQDLSKWNTKNVTNMTMMFADATAFNGDISTWNTANVTDMGSMFEGASLFNQDISNWNTTNVQDMSMMFHLASEFAGDLSKWNVANVTNMSKMFERAVAFHADLSKWNVANVTKMNEMFERTEHFNCDLKAWNTAKVTNMESMFERAKIFIQDLSKWNVGLVTNHQNFADNPNWPKEQQPHFPTK